MSGVIKICPNTGQPCALTFCYGSQCHTPPALLPPQLGWQCPKCGRGNAPWKGTCDCGPSYRTSSGTQITA